MNFQLNRPPGYSGKREHYLPLVGRDLEHIIRRVYASLASNTLCLPNSQIEELASVLVEFAEDVHNEIGIWSSLEHYNVQFFGTPLPFILKFKEEAPQEVINEHRIQHLLWVLYSDLDLELTLSPTHADLKELAKEVADFLNKRFTEIPRGSSVKTFLNGYNQFGWEVKKKLIWLGRHSYLFRNSFRNFVDENGGKLEIPVIDDFVCQHTTAWSGLGVIDILASILDISLDQRSELRSWYERHTAYYRILESGSGCLKATNLINDRDYTVRMDEDTNPGGSTNVFRVGQTVFGSLVPWNGEWYWSGEQRTFQDLKETDLKKLKEDFLKRASLFAYRYSPQLSEKAKEMVKHKYDEFVKYHDGDLAIYPNGLAMAADLQKEFRLQWESKSKEAITQVIKKYGLKGSGPNMHFPPQVLENENGVGIYFNPEEGHEIMTGFSYIIRGFRKKGVGLSQDEEEGIRSFISLESISPNFVKRLVKEYGYESIESAFLIQGDHNEHNLNYLLRCYKGAYYRKRYPDLTIA